MMTSKRIPVRTEMLKKHFMVTGEENLPMLKK